MKGIVIPWLLVSIVVDKRLMWSFSVSVWTMIGRLYILYSLLTMDFPTSNFSS